MALSRLVKLFMVAAYCTQFVFCSENVPVYMWGNLERPSEKATPLSEIYEAEFVDILKDRLKGEPLTVVFMEENLSVEDLSHKNSDGETSYPYLRSTVASSYYLPSVDTPTVALHKLANPEEINHIKLTESGLSADIIPDNRKYLFISLNDAREGESRAELLRRHNNFIEDTFTMLKRRYEKVAGIYTGHYPSWTVAEHSRARRQAAILDETILKFANVLLYTKNISLVDGDTVTLLNGMTEHSTDYNDSSIEVSLTYPDNKLKMYFTLVAGYWYFHKIDVESSRDSSIQTVVNSELYAIKGFSYRCAQTVQFMVTNHTTPYKLIFTDMQVQPFFDTPYIGFGEPYYCVGFTSVPIWACLFVVFILLSIMFFGIMMMMDIRTMDRFDDPKGKTITISSLE